MPSRGVRVEAAAGVVATHDDPVMIPDTTLRLWRLSFERTRSVVIRLGAVADVSASDHARAGLTIEPTSIIDRGTSIPYRPSFTATASYRHEFSASLSVEASFEVLGARTIDPSSSISLASAALVDLRGAYWFTESFAAVARIDNALGSKYDLWGGYPARRFYGEVGISARF
jgi:outer membrane cobalamin receptor